MEKRRQAVVRGLVGLLVANFLAWAAVFEFSGERPLEVIFFAVGQGNATFIETPQRHQILIDGGPNRQILEKLSQELPFWDRSLDVMVLTHPNQDHWQGLLEVLKRYRVSYVLSTEVVSPIALSHEWQGLIKKEGARLLVVKKPQRLRFQQGLYFDLLSPREDLTGKEVESINDTSIVSRLVFGKNSFLFPGDISSKIEHRLIEEGLDLQADVLGVAHHGSKYSSHREFLVEVNPALAVVSVGKNRYGHPSSEVLQRLKELAIDVLRTDEAGDIKVTSDGESLQLKTTR